MRTQFEVKQGQQEYNTVELMFTKINTQRAVRFATFGRFDWPHQEIKKEDGKKPGRKHVYSITMTS